MKSKVKHIFATIVLFVSLLFSISCWPPADRYRAISTTGDHYTEMTVVKLDLDGCSWMLQPKDGKKLEPVNLKDEYKKDNLNVLVTYEPYKGTSICMAGEMVTITDIKLRK